MKNRIIFEAGDFTSGFKTCDDFLDIMTGFGSNMSPEYMEAAEDAKKGGNKSMASLKKFLVAIEDIDQDKKVQDSRISSSKGNIKNFKGYHNIEVCMEFMDKNLAGLPLAKDLKKLHDALVKFQPQYTEAYEKKVRILVLEYESALYMLVTGITMTLSTNMEVVQNGNSLKFQKKEGSTGGMITKTLKDLVKQLTASNHRDYLDVMLKSVDYKPISGVKTEGTEVMLEAGVADTVELIDNVMSNIGKIGHYTKSIVSSIVRSVFGIIPLIRSILYLRYKKKADTVLALEQQAKFLEQNIEVVKNRQTDDPKKKADVIRRQQAVVDAYRRRAEKLRAELTESERDASQGVQSMNQEIHDKQDEVTDDFVLESVGFFMEKKLSKGDTEKIAGTIGGLIDKCDNQVKAGDLDKPVDGPAHQPGLRKQYRQYSNHCKEIGIEPKAFDEWKKDKEG
ncbi:MAG: hypothetical protein NC131_10900 [Roseburia sp.]|nr:hypothetical protein [Roseburia sp.]